MSSPALNADELRAAFDAPEPLTVGLEDEVMLLDEESLDLAPRAAGLLERLEGDPRFKGELPLAQLEIVTRPVVSLGDALEEVATARSDLAETAHGLCRPAAAGLHPFAAPLGEINTAGRYATTAREYGDVARLQLVTSLQVHVAVGGADRTLAVYNALRSRLPEIAALAANARWYAGRDTGMASARPKVAEALPRQGLPPAIDSWESFAADLAWGAASGALPKPGMWWWELRPHTGFGTLEVRVPDAQTTVAEAAGVAAFVHSLVAHLAECSDGGDLPAPVAAWRIAENRWSAARYGVEGELADLESGERRPTREVLEQSLDEVRPAAERMGSAELLDHARALVAENGAVRQRAVGAERGARGLAAWLAERFTA